MDSTCQTLFNKKSVNGYRFLGRIYGYLKKKYENSSLFLLLERMIFADFNFASRVYVLVLYPDNTDLGLNPYKDSDRYSFKKTSLRFG